MELMIRAVVHPWLCDMMGHLTTRHYVGMFDDAAYALFAQATGAGPDKRVVLVLDNAGWHTSRALAIPDGLHLVYLPAQTPELQPAEHLWPLLNEAVANRSFADIAALDDRLEQRCRQLLAEPARIQAATRFHWWPTDHSGAS